MYTLTGNTSYAATVHDHKNALFTPLILFVCLNIGRSSHDCPEEHGQRVLGQAMSDAIRAKTSQTYSSVKSGAWYIASGTSEDWFYEKASKIT